MNENQSWKLQPLGKYRNVVHDDLMCHRKKKSLKFRKESMANWLETAVTHESNSHLGLCSNNDGHYSCNLRGENWKVYQNVGSI